MNELIQNKTYINLLDKIGKTYSTARDNAKRAINSELVRAYWNIGNYIVEYEQKGNIKADYGDKLILELAKDLKYRYGKGFSKSNLVYMRLFYIKYPKLELISNKLFWSHYFELLKLDDDLERSFYEKQTINENWSIRELKRQKQSALFHRLALSKDKQGILELAKKGQIIKDESDIIKPQILEFLDLPEPHQYTENELEQAIINNLQQYLLELGKGFAFVGRQYRITLNNRHFRVDLVFYHIILKCYVLIDLKIGEVEHNDLGQMNMYLGYFAEEENREDDNEPIGIVLTKEKEDIMIKYARYGMNSKLFVSKYELYLPDRKILEEKVKEILNR
jgi:predicted nuclease of restriction endonuclease-like (RecB) superfamily